MKFDLIVYNGKIYTLEEEGQFFSAMGIKSGKITRLFSEVPENLTKIAKKIINLKGKTVLPGLIDSHVHFIITAVMKELSFTISELVNGVLKPESLGELQEKATRLAKTRPENQPLLFNSCVTASFKERRLPNKKEIDEWFGDRMVAFFTVDGHATSFSSKGLLAMGINPENHDGFLDEGMEEFNMDNMLAVFTKSIKIPMVLHGIQQTVNEALQYGIVGIHCMDGFQSNPKKDLMLTFLKIFGRRLPLRLRLYPQVRKVKKLEKLVKIMSAPRVGGCGAWEMDGAVGAKTAAFYKPYIGQPENFGEILYPAEELSADIESAYNKGFQITSHAIGTKAIDHFINALEPIMAKNSDSANRLRHRIDHFEFPSKKGIERAISKLNLLVVPQPGFNWINANYPGMQMYEKYLDPEIVALQNPLRTIIDQGGVICGSTDSPIQSLSPFQQIYGMVDFPIEAERLTVYEAFRTYTYNGAYSTFEENTRGSLSIGKEADFIIMDKNPFIIPKSEILNLTATSTFIKGKEIRPDNSKPWAYLMKLLSKKSKKL